MDRLAWHFDFHSHRNIRINHAPDAAGVGRTLSRYGVEEIITFAKGHCGYSYYPTQVGTPHPQMRGDAFGDVVKACKKKGIRVLAYVSFGIDGEAGRQHPDWLQVFSPDKPAEISPDWYNSLCPFTPYLDQLMLPQIREILERYPVDGFFFDTMGAMGVCYCACCQRDFRAAVGLELPRRPEDTTWGTYGEFRRERGRAMLERVGRFITAIKADAKVGFNQIGTVRFPEDMPPGISCLTLDFATHGAQSLQASMCAAYGSTARLPSDVMPTIFNQGWGDWSPRPLPTLEQIALPIWARKCRPYMGDRLHPANRLDPVTVRAVRFLAGVEKRLRAAYPADDAKLTPDILLLHGPRAMYGEDLREFSMNRAGILPLVGAHRLLLDTGANFAIAAEFALPNHLAGCRLVILPEMPGLEPATALVLRQYVNDGGRLLVIGKVPRVQGAPLDWLGVSQQATPWQDHIYLPLWEQTDEASPVLVRGDFHKLDLRGAETVLPAIRPYDCDHGVRFGWGIGPASDQPSEFPALTRLAVGRGEVWYLEARICSDYEANANWTQIAWMRALLDRLVPTPRAQVVSESGAVEVVAHANAASTWLFLINHGGEQMVPGLRSWTRTFAPVPAYPVVLRLAVPNGRTPRSVTMAGKPVRYDQDGQMLVVPLTMNRIWKVLRVDWE